MSVFHTISLKPITKLDKDVVHHESWKPIILGVKRSKVKVTEKAQNIAGFSTLL